MRHAFNIYPPAEYPFSFFKIMVTLGTIQGMPDVVKTLPAQTRSIFLFLHPKFNCSRS
jgi:hypothetical protein